jgi:zinc transporter
MGTTGDTGLQHAFLLDGKGGAKQLDWAGIAAWTPADGVLWINLDYQMPDVKEWLESGSGLDPVTRDALLDSDPRPRAVKHGDDLMLIVRGINQNEGSDPEDMVSVRSWIEPRRVITMRHRPSRSLKQLAAETERGKGPNSAGELAVELVEKIVEHVVARVDRLGDEIASCEDEVLTGTRSDLRARLADLRRRAIGLRRFLAPQREALAKLAVISLPWLTDNHHQRVAELADRMTRTVEELDAARDRAAVTQEELSSRQSETTNQRLYVLSIITAVFLPLGFVCSLLGVNVGGVPLQTADWAFWALIAMFGIGVAIQIYIFKKRGWIKKD